jgi:hypothetical protein
LSSEPLKNDAMRPEPQAGSATKKAYEPPRLELIGDIFDLVLGGSPGTGDSGNPFTHRFPSGAPPFGPPPG